MDIGLFFESTHYATPVAKVAQLAEARGLESLWLPEHTHIPLTGSTNPRVAEVPKAYSHLLDPFVALTAAAGATTELRLGTGICLIIERDTIQTAKAVASLDHVSDGRFLFGIGAGWNRAEMENHGVDFRTRFQKMCDQVEAFKVIWRDEEAAYHGPFVDFEPMQSWPKPVQSPHPPILLGGESIHTLRRIVTHCDGWLPRGIDPDQVLEGMQTLKRLADEAERDIPVSVFAPPPREEVLRRFQDAGVQRVILMLPAEEESKTLSRLDRLARFVH
ncbi:MAG: LLM class F420-dependent oxidoreductase [Pseudomonadales bacterium]|jgi:probable F420-dependent oxidoreductase|nr:LLM class F420-dependent oxidoreductase [Pseudomonadales bacterium]HJN49322.1 LLM class F420-dependent oxidoreductase [Pseudomonadales bacterium]|tara:strand:+ start:50 stop:874 length:825 start_codon:yes stop_codon:yes gene_type:complete